MMRPTTPLHLTAIVLIQLLCWFQTFSKETRLSQTCYTSEQVQCLLHRNCTNGSHSHVVELLTGRVRFPGTASSEERNFLRYFEGDTNDNKRYQSFFSNCTRLCFSSSLTNPNLALRPLSLTNSISGHVPYDVVASKMQRDVQKTLLLQYNETTLNHDDFLEQLNQTVLITTLRDPGSYANKWYRFRAMWEFKNILPQNISAMGFEEWVEAIKWRRNMMTRVLGAESNRLSMPKPNMIYTIHDGSDSSLATLAEDAYMQEQNRLGPEHSHVSKLAMERLKKDFVHFGLFHRLRESWDLLGHYFCWNMDRQKVKVGKDLRGQDAIYQLVGNDTLEASRLWKRIQELNRLDVALLDAADAIMDDRLAVMQSEKDNGVICNFLNQVKVTCAVSPGEDDTENNEEL